MPVQEVYWYVQERKTPEKAQDAGLGRRRNGNSTTVVTETSTSSPWSSGGVASSSSRSRHGNQGSVHLQRAMMTCRLLLGSPLKAMPREGVSCGPSAVTLQGPVRYSFLYPVLEISPPKLFYNYFLSTHFLCDPTIYRIIFV